MPPAPPRRARGGRIALISLAALLAVGAAFGGGFAAGRGTAPDKADPGAKGSEAVDSDVTHGGDGEAEEAAEEGFSEPSWEPKPIDFELEVKVLDKQCFGSAGCSIEYQVDPTYLGDTDDLADMVVQITYEVTGDESGKQIGTISVDGGSYATEVRTASTSGDGVRIKARVTDVNSY